MTALARIAAALEELVAIERERLEAERERRKGKPRAQPSAEMREEAKRLARRAGLVVTGGKGNAEAERLRSG